MRIIEARVTATGADGTRIAGSYRLITTLTDHRAFPATALVRLYHERWEIESAFLALRHTLLGGRVLRSGDRPGTGAGTVGAADALPAAAYGHGHRCRDPAGHQPRPGQLHHRPGSRPRPGHRRRRNLPQRPGRSARRHRPGRASHAATRPAAPLQRPQDQSPHLPLPGPPRPPAALPPPPSPRSASPSTPRRWTPVPAASTTRPKTPGHPGHPPAASASLPSSPASPTATGRHANSPECSTSTPATWPPSSANRPCSASSPTPAWAPTGSTRRHRRQPRQPHQTLNYAALACDRLRRPLTRWPLTRRLAPIEEDGDGPETVRGSAAGAPLAGAHQADADSG